MYESHSMRLDEFATYLGHRFPRCALIEEVGYEEQPRAADNNSDSNDLLIPGKHSKFLQPANPHAQQSHAG